MSEEEWTVRFEVDGQPYDAHFVRRPFREGLEVSVEVGDATITLAELGYGEAAILQALEERIRKLVGSPPG